MKSSKWANLSRTLLLTMELVLLLSLAWGASVAQAQQAGVSLAAEVGLDGYCKEGMWIPVKVRAENTGPAIDGTVEISFQNEVGGTSIYAEAVSLPTTSRKDLFLYFYPPQYSRALKLSLVEDERVIVSKNLTLSCLTTDNMLFGVMSNDPSAYDILNEIQPLTGFVKVAHLQPADLPNRPEGWDGLDALIVADTDTGTLTPEQRESLSMWLSSGGKLMVMGGSSWQGTAAGLKDLLPIEITSVQTLSSLSQLEGYVRSLTPIEGEVVLTDGDPRAGATVLVQQQGIPLLVKREVGFGEVIFFGGDPSLQPLSNWDGMRDVYGSVLGAKTQRPEWANLRWDVYTANRAVSTLEELNIPPILSVCGWLILYVIVIGPVNFFVLHRLKRRDLAWLTVPALVILFSGITYVYGSVYRGRLPVMNRIAVIQAWDNSAEADVRAVVGFYSPRRTKYTLQTNEKFMFYPFQLDGSSLQGGNNWYSLAGGDGEALPDVQVEIGGMKSFSMRGRIPALEFSHDLTVTIGKANPVLTGQVINNSAFTLQDAILVTPGEWMQLDDLAPGESRNIKLLLTPTNSGPEFYGLEPYQVLGNGPPLYEQDQDWIRREALFNTMLNSSSYYYGNYGNWGIYLMGWIEEPFVPVDVEGGASETIDTNLYIVRLTPAPQYQGNTWNLTPGLMSWEASMPGASPYFGSEVPAGGHVLRFHPALPISFGQVKQLTLNIQSVSGASPAEASVSLWNFDTAEWDRLDNFSWGVIDIPEPARYVGPGGESRLRIVSLSNYSFQVSPATLSPVLGP